MSKNAHRCEASSIPGQHRARDLPGFTLTLVFDPTASDTLIDYIIDAFCRQGLYAIVESVVLGDPQPPCCRCPPTCA